MPDTDDVLVRAFRPGDEESVADLCSQLGYPTSTSDVERRLREAGDDGHAVFMAESPDGRVVGWVQVCAHTILVSDRHAEIEGLVVDRDWRSRGVGHSLMRRAEEWARHAGCKAVNLRSNVVREGARPFYEDIGYEVVKTQWAFRKTLK
jgi:GNAT superfamily N-acetyltransferase